VSPAGASTSGPGLAAHPWPTSPAEARALQEVLRQQVVLAGTPGPLRFIAGVDVHFSRDGATAWAAAALVDATTLELIESALVTRPVAFPYVTGLLAFREAPIAADAVRLLSRSPDLLQVDGQGIAHPRRFGIACHLGLLLDLPTIGVAKSRLIGTYAEPPPEQGALTPLEDKGEIIGAVLRTKANTRPLYISTGHRIALAAAVDNVLATTTYRLPEPTRLADKLSRAHQG